MIVLLHSRDSHAVNYYHVIDVSNQLGILFGQLSSRQKVALRIVPSRFSFQSETGVKIR